MSTKFTGAGLYMSFAGSPIHADFQELTIEREMGMVESTAGADTHESYLNTYKKGNIKIKVFDQTPGTAVTAYKVLMAEGVAGTFIYGEEGTATGKPKHTIYATVKKQSPTYPFAGASELEFELQPNSTTGWSDSTW